MATLDKLSFEGKYNHASTGLFKNNTGGEITAERARTLVTDEKDSVPFTLDDSYTWPFPQVTASGTNTYAATLAPVITAYATGQKFQIKFTNASSGVSTLNLNALGAKKIFINPTTQATTGNITASQIYLLIYDEALDSAAGGFLMVGGSSAGTSGTQIPFGPTTGTNTYAISASPAVTSYTDGDLYHIRIGTSSTGVVTLNFDSVGAKKLLLTDGSQASDQNLIAGVDYLVAYNSALDSGAGAFVVVNELQHGLMNARGDYDASSNLFPSAGGSGVSGGIRHGDTFRISVAGTLGGTAVNIGDFITTSVDAPGQTASLWYIIPGINSLKLKTDSLVTLRTETASYTLDATDLANVNLGKQLVIMMNVAGANNLTIPLNATQAFPVGTVIGIRQIGAGQTTIVATGGVTVNAPLNALKLASQNALAFIEKTATNTWYANGELSL